MKKKLYTRIKQYGWIMGGMIIVILAISIIEIAGSYAYNQHRVEQENLLKAQLVSCEVIENEMSAGAENTFEIKQGEETRKRVQFKNTGETPVFVRVSFVETWTGEEGEWIEYNHTYAVPNWTDSWKTLWQIQSDGWYYYNQILGAGETTEEILSSVSFLPELPQKYADGRYQLVFTMEVVQCSNEPKVNEDALEKVFAQKEVKIDMSMEHGVVISGNVTWSKEK